MEGSSWSARSRVAARTNELDADERRRIIGSGEEPFVLACEKGVVCCPRVRGRRSGLASTHSAARRVQAGAMIMCPGTGLLSQMIERGLVAGSCRWSERAR